MQIEHGTTRVVVLLPILGIVIKFPIIRIWGSIRLAKIAVRALRMKIPRTRQVLLPCIKDSLFLGIANNWREFWFYLRNRHPILKPTFFSFFGLFNIQNPKDGPKADRTETQR
ncbi:MAG: hypothetical protein A2261_00960 [Candidatus Magasanikbacteria bacterium RIFOXYA2_FULL_44_8]|uniref:Uncharacterized protein n=1 Tax=Candidatus Magasanikbacteria bacterium RIFOXYA2_FULL_44_8 TaxID=1798696 RepID=A0A1F6NIL1_9BACT|nr:MAG: hypothetical protein A2261_00960 [Candidatus Magasanikbacteria bacterium RIFOXYA2_FULL_44_8]